MTQDLSEVQAMHEVEWSRSEKYSLRDLAKGTLVGTVLRNGLLAGFMVLNAF